MEWYILIIDDSPDDREALIRALKKSEDAIYSYTDIADGLRGVEAAAAKRPDCVLLDYSLPGLNGLEILKRLHNADPFLPVIMLTGQGNETIAVQAMKEGAQDYLVKSSITPPQLQRTITAAIEHVTMERSLQEHQDKIKRQAEELKYINEELETFTYIASHDMRSPLVSLKGFSMELEQAAGVVSKYLDQAVLDLALGDEENLQQAIRQRIPKALHYITSAADKMERLTGAILKLSRLGHREITLEPVQTRPLVDQCVSALAHQIEQSKTTVKIGDLPAIFADRTGIEQVFGNLIDNAVKYLDPERPGEIVIDAVTTSTHTEFTVTDNGRGIADDDKHKVFEIFRRAGDVENIPGEGMGMAYVRMIVRRHLGKIWFESKPGKGTSVHFTIANQAA